MLVLTRKGNQSIMIGDDIEVSVLAIMGEKVRIGIEAPRSVPVFRKEVYLEIQAERGQVTVTPQVEAALRQQRRIADQVTHHRTLAAAAEPAHPVPDVSEEAFARLLAIVANVDSRLELARDDAAGGRLPLAGPPRLVRRGARAARPRRGSPVPSGAVAGPSRWSTGCAACSRWTRSAAGS